MGGPQCCAFSRAAEMVVVERVLSGAPCCLVSRNAYGIGEISLVFHGDAAIEECTRMVTPLSEEPSCSEPSLLLSARNFPPKQSLPPPSPAEHGCWEDPRFLSVLEQLFDIRDCISPVYSAPVLPQPSSCSLLLFFAPYTPFVLRVDLQAEK